MRQIIPLVVLAFILAACGAEQQELPTEFVLPSSTSASTQSPATTVQPTEAVPLPTTVESIPSTPTASVNPEEILEQMIDSGPPFDNNSNTGNPLFQSELPPPEQEVEWVVVADQPVQVLDCADPECSVIGTLETGASVDVTTPGSEWHTINYEGDTGYVFATFVQQPQQTSNPFEPLTSNLPPGIDPNQLPTQQPQQSNSPFDPTGNSSFPPGMTSVPGELPPLPFLFTATPTQ